MNYQQSNGQGTGLAPQGKAVPANPANQNGVEQVLERLVAERRCRGSFLPEQLFADPAWDILLALALSEARQQRFSISRLCERVDLPATTVLRWITTLVEAGLLVRLDDVNDKRRKYLELSSHARAKMLGYCSTLGAALPLAA
jgi:DNA-binding MarR family transcriptional regulator